MQCMSWSWTDLNLLKATGRRLSVEQEEKKVTGRCFPGDENPLCSSQNLLLCGPIGTGDQVIKKKTSHLIFASDGKGLTQLTHIYAEPFEEASRAARKWRDETHPTLWILKVRAQPQGFQVGSVVLPGTIEEEEEGAKLMDIDLTI